MRRKSPKNETGCIGRPPQDDGTGGGEITISLEKLMFLGGPFFLFSTCLRRHRNRAPLIERKRDVRPTLTKTFPDRTQRKGVYRHVTVPTWGIRDSVCRVGEHSGPETTRDFLDSPSS